VQGRHFFEAVIRSALQLAHRWWPNAEAHVEDLANAVQVPGFSIALEAPVHVLPRGSDWPAIINDVRLWLRAESQSFPLEKVLRGCPCPHHPEGKLVFQVSTTPLDDPSEKFLIVQRYGELRIGESVEKALRNKLRKLARAEADKRLLILERDQPWVHPRQICEEVERLRPSFSDLAVVDEIWIADTATFGVEKDYLCFSTREGEATDESFSFYKGKLQPSRGGARRSTRLRKAGGTNRVVPHLRQQHHGSANSVNVDMRLEFCGEALRGVMHRQDVDLIDTDEPIHDSIGRANDFTYDGVFELRYGAAGFRELDQAIRGRYETGNNDRGVVGRILTDECLNGG